MTGTLTLCTRQSEARCQQVCLAKYRKTYSDAAYSAETPEPKKNDRLLSLRSYVRQNQRRVYCETVLSTDLKHDPEMGEVCQQLGGDLRINLFYLWVLCKKF